jgi:hypothetical protein
MMFKNVLTFLDAKSWITVLSISCLLVIDDYLNMFIVVELACSYILEQKLICSTFGRPLVIPLSFFF